MLGGAAGDALGAGCEMMTRDGIAKVYGRVTAYIPEAEQKFGGGLKRIPGCYTDDTEMAIGLALSLVATRGGVDTIHIAEQHARLYSPWRGYGSGTIKVLEAQCPTMASWVAPMPLSVPPRCSRASCRARRRLSPAAWS